jgi:hypothetical protein
MAIMKVKVTIAIPREEEAKAEARLSHLIKL